MITAVDKTENHGRIIAMMNNTESFFWLHDGGNITSVVMHVWGLRSVLTPEGDHFECVRGDGTETVGRGERGARRRVSVAPLTIK